MAKGAVIARILSEYDAKGTKQARKDLSELQGKFSEFGKKATQAFAIAAAASAAFAIKMGVDSVKAAMAEQQSMAILANTLKNVTGATNEQIDSVNSYIRSTMLRLNVQDDLLRPSLQALVIATHDVSKAESLQQVALDVSANKGKDLTAVSVALAKAYAGNFNALKRLGIPLSETLIKSKDFIGIVKELESATKGSAAAAADTFAGKISRIGLAFDEVKKTIGNAIILALEPFLQKFMKFLPQIEKWLDENAKKIAAFFITGISYGIAFAQVLYDTFSFVARNIKTFETLGAVIAAAIFGAKVAASVQALVTGVMAIIKVMKVLRTASLGAAAAEALATGGISAAAGAAAFAVALGAITLATNKFDKDAEKAAGKVGNLKFNFKGLTTTAADYLKGLTGVNTATAKNTNLTAQQTKALADLKKMGIVPTTEKDAIELEAARQNLVKQGNIAEQQRIQAILDGMTAQLAANEATARYNDLLAALSDSHISSEEVAALAKKWGISQDAVVAYIAQITGAAAFDPSQLSSPGAVAAAGWQKALDALNAYYAKLASGTILPPSLVPGSGNGAGSSVGTPGNPPVTISSTLPYGMPNTVLGGIVLPATPTASFGSKDTAAQYGFGANFMSGTSGGSTTIINVQGNIQTQSDNAASIAKQFQLNQLSGKTALNLGSIANI